MPVGNPRNRRFWLQLTTPLLAFLVLVLLEVGACAPPLPPPSPPIKIPSIVNTEEGIEFSVYGLKLPGTSQELKLRKGGATTWLPLSIFRVITFTGPEDDRFRPALISLTSGERFNGELFSDQIIEGTTDVGYWNIPLKKVRQIGLGEE